ncbi:hypothetical protein FW774_14540 [Pedobacter sp. BS3]|uniref:hypothetical protein n=1 Tax=Pedobacter sp. BS3 TaxID=2567937 RepID=UPI0011EDEE06|nr:hypothetical protein [Pedobacter sp. BS3]TZF82711.1 hypothetical protein FW774_14540 [Pedobacter sp. BS3]
MKKIYFPAFLVVLLSGCDSIRYYMPVMLKADLTYMPKPMSFDSIKTSNYVTATYGGKSMANLDEESTFGQFSFSRSHYLKNINVSYGGGGYFGTVENNSIDTTVVNVLDRKNFSGFNLNTSANLVTSSGRTDFRVIGLELAYNKEFGDYYHYRKSVIGIPDAYSITRSDLFSAGLSSEVIWHTKNSIHTQFGFKLTIGKTFGNLKYKGVGSHNNNDDIIWGNGRGSSAFAFFFQLKQFHFIFDQSTASRFSVGYRF